MEEEGWKQSSGEGWEEKQHEVYLSLSEATVVKFNVADIEGRYRIQLCVSDNSRSRVT